MKPKKLTKTQIENTLKSQIEDAVAFVESDIAPDQEKAAKYFSGKNTVPFEANRSRVIATKCRDVVRAVKPGLLRMFLQSGSFVEFVPGSADKAQAAEQQTKYATYILERNDGFKVLHNAFHDALVKKIGVVKAYYDETEHVEIDEYSGIPIEFITALEDQGAEILEWTLEQEASITPDGISIQPELFSAKVSKKSKKGRIVLNNVAPESFFVDKAATSVHDFSIIGHKEDKRVGDLVAMGFKFEDVYDLKAGDMDDSQQYLRSKTDNDEEEYDDPSMKPVQVTEAYMRMDIEGTGVPRLYKFICGGTDYKVLDYELCDYVPFAVFEVDPEPHAFFGRSLVEIIQDDQDAATSLLRGLLDNIAMTNNPGLAVNEQAVNVKDVLNNEIGRVIRVKGPVAGAYAEMTVGSLATSALPAIQHYEDVIKQKTGIIGAGMGLDAEALQSQTAAGVRLADQQSNAVSELIARVLAEGGGKQLAKLICTIARQHQDPEEMALDGQFVYIDPRSWTADMDMRANVGLGTNRTEERLMTLNQVITWQQGIWQAYGPDNGLVTMTGIRAAMADFAKLGGVTNIDKYINRMDPQTEQALMQKKARAAQQQGQASDPNAAFLQAEQMKTSARVQADMMKTQLDAQKAQMQDDRERDKMAQDLFIETARMASQPVNIPAIMAEQEKPRV